MNRICFVNGSMGRGGAERVISILSCDIVKYGYQTDICLLLSNQVDYNLDKTTRVFDFSAPRSSLVKNGFLWISKLRHYIKSEKPSIMIAMSAKEFFLAKIASFGMKVNVMVSERNDPHCDGRGKFTDFLTTLLYPHASLVIFQTKRAQSFFNSRVQDNSLVIPNPVTVNCHTSYKKSKTIVSVGRLEPQKNQQMLLYAFSEISGKHPEYRLIIYGKGSLLSELESLASKLEIANKVIFAGEVSDVQRRIADADMFVLSSNYEGLSNALLEALSIGLPCISTACAGSEDCIVSGESGLIVPVGNKEALAQAIETFICNDDFRVECGRKGRQSAEKFRVENVTSMWCDAFDCAIEDE